MLKRNNLLYFRVPVHTARLQNKKHKINNFIRKACDMALKDTKQGECMDHPFYLIIKNMTFFKKSLSDGIS